MSFSYPSAGWTRRPPHCVFVVAATLILTTAAALTACTPATTAPDDGPAGVSASVVQDRTQIATGTMSVEVHNDGSDPFVVTSMDYADPRLAGAVTWSGTLTVPSGSKRDVSFSVPSPVCDAGDSGQTGHVRLSFKADAEQATADYPVEDPYGFVASHLATACFSATLAQHASVTLTDVTTAGAGGTEIAVMHVQVTVTGDDAVRIESAESTTLLQPEVGGWMWRCREKRAVRLRHPPLREPGLTAHASSAVGGTTKARPRRDGPSCETGAYQLDLVTPGSSPLCAMSRKRTREMPNFDR